VQKKKKEEEDEEEEYEVESIVSMRETKKGRMFRLRWVNHKPKDDTWELEDDLNCPELLEAFFEKQKEKEKEQEVDPDEEYEVEKVLDFRGSGSRREFLIHWKGCPKSQDTWEPEAHLSCKELIDEFMEKEEKFKKTDARELRLDPKKTDRLTLGASRYRHSRRQDKKARITYQDFLEF